MDKIKIDVEPKLQFNRGNPDSPVPPGIDDHDLTGDDEKQITDVESSEDFKQGWKKKKNELDKNRIKENKEENTEMLTF